MVWTAVFLLSLVLFLGSIYVLRAVIIRMPADYFSSSRTHPPDQAKLSTRVSKNLLGVVLIAVGIIMLVTPGQGALTILMGLILVEFPGKYRLERWLIGRPQILSVINRWRTRAGRAALVLD